MSELKKRVFSEILKWAGRAFLGLFLFLLLIIVLLYIPAVQDFIVPKVLDKINSSSQMTVSVDRFRLSFPLDVSAEGVSVMQKEDTMLMASSANVSVKFFPLLSGKVRADGISLRNLFFKTGSPDSTMYLRARVNSATLRQAGVILSDSEVGVGDITLDGGRIEIALKQDTTPPSPPSEVPWKIRAERLNLRNIDYRMTMAPSVDSLSVALDNLVLVGGDIDLSGHTADISSLLIDGIDAGFHSPSDPPQESEAVVDTAAVDSVPWTIRLGRFSLKNGRALYARSGVVPSEGLDMDYLSVSHIDIEVDSFYNRAAEVVVPLRKLSASERSGLSVEASGLIAMTSDEIVAHGFRIMTNASDFSLDAVVGMGTENAPVELTLGSEVSVSDLQMAFPGMKDFLAQLPQNRKIGLTADLSGTMKDLSIGRVAAEMPGHFKTTVSGNIANLSDFDKMDGRLKIDGNLANINFLKPTLMDVRAGRNVTLPPLKLRGDVDFRSGTIRGNVKAVTPEGKLAMKASWNGTRQAYDVDIETDRFPVRSFMPRSGFGNVTAGMTLNGRGLDIFSPRTSAKAHFDAVSVEYNRAVIHDLVLDADIGGGNAEILLKSDNPAAEMTLAASGNLSGRQYDWNVDGDITRLDLYRLGLSDSLFNVSAAFRGRASVTPSSDRYTGSLDISRLDMAMGATRMTGTDIMLSLESSDSLTLAKISNKDLNVDFVSHAAIDSLAARMSGAVTLLSDQINERRADVIALQKALPPFNLQIRTGQDNLLGRLLADGGIEMSSAKIGISNDSLIRIDAVVDSLSVGSSRFDHIALDVRQRKEFLIYRASIDNNPGTMDNFAHVQINGYLAGDKFAAFLKQRDIKNRTGYSLGGIVAMTDSTMQLKLVPFKPVIGYKEWTVNKDNFIKINTVNRHIDANLLMKNAESSLHLYTSHDSLSQVVGNEDIVLTIDNIKIADWIAVNPYAPPMKGDLSANMRFALSPSSISGNGTVSLSEFFYGKKRVGTLDLDLDLTTKPSGAVFAVTSMRVDGAEVMEAKGNLNDTASVNPFMLDFELNRFPLSIANPFIGASTGTLSGYLSGKMDITGSLSSPRFDGYLDFDSAAMKVNMLGTTFRFSEEKIPVDSNVIMFDDYKIYGINDNPLTINGRLDMGSMSDIYVDIAANAQDMQVVGNQKRRGSDVYGKAFISLDANARGSMSRLKADAVLTVLPGTNVTYVIPGGASSLSGPSDSDMVRFVNFADTTAVEVADSVPLTESSVNLTAVLNVAQGSTISVDLSSNGQNKVQVQGSGTLDYTMNYLGDTRFTGRLNINDGFVRYTPPFMSEKLFEFQEVSYVAFNGDMLNPRLNVHAVDRMRANVTQEGQNSRLINFDVSLAVTGTLQNMDVAFDLSTDDDVTVENELQAMSPEQRANQAMNLLLYNVYTGPGTKGSANLSGNPLFSFLESKLNSWMANNVKGVDITFGIDQYDRTVDGASSTTTSYSYKVSKSFLNDRFKVVVGGNYSTDADADENFSQNLINDISFEYMLNRSGSMYIRLFRHTGYESILEGEVTQTGVGFVYKRKLRTLGDLFRFGRRRHDKELPGQKAVIVPGDAAEKKDEQNEK